MNLTSCSTLSTDQLPVHIHTARRLSIQHPQDRPDFRRTDCADFQTHLEVQILFDPELRNGMAIDTCVENFSGAVLQVLAASLKCRPREDPRLPTTAWIQDLICLKNWLRRRWQVTRDPALKAEVYRLQLSVTRRLNDWRNDQWRATLETLDPEDQSLWRTTKGVMTVPTPSSPWSTRWESLSQILRSRSPCRQSGYLVSPGGRSFVPSSYRDS